jgi:hypothetical protein
MARRLSARYDPPVTLCLIVVYWTLGRVCSHFLCLQCYLPKNGLTSGAFVGALVIGLALHYKELVATDVYEYPQEWFPSVSATIGYSSYSCGLIQATFTLNDLFSISLSHFALDLVLHWFCCGTCSVVSENHEYQNPLSRSDSSKRCSLERGHM